MNKIQAFVTKVEDGFTSGLIIAGKVTMMSIAVLALAHGAGMITGLYDLSFMYDHFNVSTAQFGAATLGPTGVYTGAKVLSLIYKTQKTYNASMDKFNTDRVVNAQTLSTNATNTMLAAIEENTAATNALLVIEDAKAVRYEELVATLDVETLKAKTEEL